VAVITISGFLAVLLCYVPVLNWAIACLAGFFGQGVELVLDFIQYIPGARIQWPTGPLGSLAFILTIITIWLALRGLRHWGSRRNYFEKPDRPSVFAGVVENFRSVISAHKYLKNALFVVILVPALGVSWWNHNALGSHLDSDWLVAGCPVGQGDSFVVNLGDSHGILIDAGPDPILVDQCLTTLKIETIDLLILSHFHDDHVGGLSGAIKTREVGTIWVSNSNDEVAQSQSVFSLLASQSLSATRVQSGFSFGTDGVNFAGFKTSSNIAAVNFAGFEFSSTESSGTESAGTESTTSESFGTESAAPKSAGTEFVSTETASTESAAPKYAGNGSATSDSAGTKSAAPESSGTESVSVELAAPAPAAPQLADFKTSPNLGSAGSDLKVLVVSALPGEDLEGNEASVVVYLELRGLSMLFLGDSEVMAQAAALENLKTLGIDQIDLVKVAHHGSKTQDAELYKYLGARVALIGVGENNYGHPHPETVAMLKNLGTTVVNTLDQGLCGIIKTADNEQIFALGGG
jgi:beta-lactamase superfamily II metal-dependent hydrolase